MFVVYSIYDDIIKSLQAVKEAVACASAFDVFGIQYARMFEMYETAWTLAWSNWNDTWGRVMGEAVYQSGIFNRNLCSPFEIQLIASRAFELKCSSVRMMEVLVAPHICAAVFPAVVTSHAAEDVVVPAVPPYPVGEAE